MKQRRQRDFFEKQRDFAPRLTHGGESAEGKRKLVRPFDSRRPVHVTMRSSKAKGRYSLRSKQVEVRRIVEAASARGNVKIHKFANVGNHLHLLISCKSREAFQKFLRTVSGLVARAVTGARKGKPFGKFWDLLAHSRVVTGYRAFRSALDYVFINQIDGQFGAAARNDLVKAKRQLKDGFLVEYRDG